MKDLMSKALEQSLAEAALAMGMEGRNDDLIQRAERWLSWYPTRYAMGETELGVCQSGAAVIRELVAARRADASTQRNPSPVDLSAPDWLARYAVPIADQVLPTWKRRLWSAREEANDAVQRP